MVFFYDYEKCFDKVAWTIAKGLLHDLGFPVQISNAMFGFNEHIVRRFKLGPPIGPTFPNTNSICQGCPLAIIRINALIAAWVQVLRNHPDTQQCRMGAFIDDKNLCADTYLALKSGLDVTRAFDNAVGATVNQN